jgi:hypothetical protein
MLKQTFPAVAGARRNVSIEIKLLAARETVVGPRGVAQWNRGWASHLMH